MPTISQAVLEGARRLLDSSIDQPRRTAGVLLCNVLGVDRTYLLTRSEEQIDKVQYDAYLALVERRAAGEPMQHITGHQEFFGLDFVVTPDALIPRPETEFLVERVLALLDDSAEARPIIVDVGTGSGCIAVALAVRLPHARVIATDISEAALAVARRNAERHGVRDRIGFLSGDLLSPLAECLAEGTIDIVASNPPYVNVDRPELIQREVREWEPPQALFGGLDGLEFYRRLLAESAAYLKPRGHLVLEIGYSQLDPITKIIDASGWKLIDVSRDLQGIPRTISLGRP